MFLMCGVAVGGGDDPVTPPVPVAEAWTSWAFVVPPTDGPPASSCADDVGAAPEAVQWPRRTARTPSARGRPAPRDKQLVLDGAPRPIALHTAMSVDTIPQVGLEGDDAVRARLAAVWDRADAGEPVRLSFFGASHTGGDYWTGHLRRRLQDRWGDRGHGFILPAPLYAGYRGQDVNLCATHGWQGAWVGRTGGPDDGLYGFMGGSVRTDQAGAFGWLETTRENPHGRAFSRLDLFALAAPEAGSVTLDVDGQVSHTVSLAAPAPRLARVRLGVEDGAHRVRVTAVGDGEVRLFGASLERDGPGVIVDAMGIRGRTARTWRAWDPSLLAAGLSALGPDVVVLAYGTNEAADTAYEMGACARPSPTTSPASWWGRPTGSPAARTTCTGRGSAPAPSHRSSARWRPSTAACRGTGRRRRGARARCSRSTSSPPSWGRGI